MIYTIRKSKYGNFVYYDSIEANKRKLKSAYTGSEKMRRNQQKQLLGLLDTLQEADEQIEKNLINKNNVATVQLLTDCQNCAIQIGNFIEKTEGEGTAAVSYLEDYCELIYQISIGIDNSENCRKNCRLLKAQIKKIRRSIYDLKIKFEIALLPYKASMWDSMESVWIAAKDDPQCEAYVVPIPYYDKLQDGTFGQMYYEGNEFPGYVPVTDWKEYNIEERHPDIIYIHNPYDNDNYVTSVHPVFYSKRLKNYTDMLVYIPYYVSLEYINKDLCVTPAVIYADRIVVQSEKVKNDCLEVLHDFAEENNCVKAFENYKRKFLVLGSPKFDKVINTKRENCKIPQEWEKLIQKPDGTRKKVVLYNTSVRELINGDEKVLLKMKSVFNFFKNSDDIVLLWRPHPLSMSTYKSMRSALLEEYQKITEEYKCEGFGIYDESADLNRAIAVSDAYYGDESSLVVLYELTGKPAMIQSRGTEGNNYLAFECMYDDGEYIWFSAFCFNALFKMKKSSRKAEYVGSFPNERMDGFRLYMSIAAYGSKLFFAPGSANEIAEYDIKTGLFKKINFAKPKIQTHTDYWINKFIIAIQYKTWIFFIGCLYPAIIRYDINSGRIDYFSDWVESLSKFVNDPDDGYFVQKPCINGSVFAVAASNANAVLMFDMQTCTGKIYEVGGSKCNYAGMCFDGSNYWLAPRDDGPIVKWNPKTKEYKEFSDFPKGYVKCRYSFQGIAYVNGYVWLLPSMTNIALKINVQDENISIAEEFQPVCGLKGTSLFSQNYIFSKSSGNMIYAETGKDNKFIEYNVKTKELYEKNILFSEENKITLKRNLFAEGGILHENALSLEDYIEYIKLKTIDNKQINSFKDSIKNSDGTSGAAIYSYCKNKILKSDKKK